MRWTPPILFSPPVGVVLPVEAAVRPRIGCAAVPGIRPPFVRRQLGGHAGVIVMG